MDNALIGLLGILSGIFITEHFRRRNRIENYSHLVFEKRLKLYENIYCRINAIRNASTDIIENTKYSKDERLNKWSPIILDLAEYLDQNKLYIDDDIAEHCMLTVVGVEEIYYIRNQKKREKETQNFGNNINKAISMIKVEAGLKEVDVLFKGITKAKHSSSFISEMKAARERCKKKQNL